MKKRYYLWNIITAGLVILYALVVFGVAFWLALKTWPGNEGAYLQCRSKNSIGIARAVTADTASKLRAGELVLSRWYVQGPQELTAKDRATLANAISLAMELSPAFLTPPAGKLPAVPPAPAPTAPLSPASATNQGDAPGKPVVGEKSAETKNNTPWTLNTKEECDPTNSSTAVKAGTGGDTGAFPLVTLGDLSSVPKNSLKTNLFWIQDALKMLYKRTNVLCSVAAIYRSNSLDCELSLTESERLLSNSLLDQIIVMQGGCFWISKPIDLFLLLISIALLGSACRIMGSIGLYIAQDEFTTPWAAFYFLIPPQAAILAIGYFLLIAGGLWALPTKTVPVADSSTTVVSTNATPTIVLNSSNITALVTPPSKTHVQEPSTAFFLLGAIGFLIGMFTDEATAKLGDIAAGIFKDNTRKNPLGQGGTRIKVSAVAPLFSLETVKDRRAFATILKQIIIGKDDAGTTVKDSVLEFLVNQPGFTAAKQLLQNSLIPTEDNDVSALMHPVIDGINAVLQSQSIFEETRFTGINVQPVRDKAKVDLKGASGLDMVYVNWLLLQQWNDTRGKGYFNRQTTRWLIEISGKNLAVDANVFVNNVAVTSADRIASSAPNAIRFEYQQSAVMARQDIELTASKGDQESDPVAIALDSKDLTTWIGLSGWYQDGDRYDLRRAE